MKNYVMSSRESDIHCFNMQSVLLFLKFKLKKKLPLNVADTTLRIPRDNLISLTLSLYQFVVRVGKFAA